MPIHQHVALGQPSEAPGHRWREQNHLSEDGASITFQQGSFEPRPWNADRIGRFLASPSWIGFSPPQLLALELSPTYFQPEMKGD